MTTSRVLQDSDRGELNRVDLAQNVMEDQGNNNFVLESLGKLIS
jgi:hypothetical protein